MSICWWVEDFQGVDAAERGGHRPSGANLVKLSGNFLLASVIERVGEAMALVGRAGIDRRLYLELLTSTLFTVAVYKTYGGLIAEEKFEPPGFAASSGYKDACRSGQPSRAHAGSAGILLRDALRPLAMRLGTSVSAIAIAWTLTWPGVTGAIVGARTPQQVDGWIGAASITLTDQDRDEIAAAIRRTKAGAGPARHPRRERPGRRLCDKQR